MAHGSLTGRDMRKRTNSPTSSRRLLWAAVALPLSVGVLLAADWYRAVPLHAKPAYVGGSRCMECHTQQGHAWTDSHHDLAMDRATPETVRGDFSGQTLEHFGITSTMFRDGERYMVRTEGPDGKLDDFEVQYVFGYEPLQQYMVELQAPSGGDESAVGRVQVLRISWDTERSRWFYLKPPDVDEKLAPDDPLHWTGSAQNWNHMCADCHSTNLKKNSNEKKRN